MTREQLQLLARRLLAAAEAFVPGATAVGQVIDIANQLNADLKAVRERDPEAWARISEDYPDALAAFDASHPQQ